MEKDCLSLQETHERAAAERCSMMRKLLSAQSTSETQFCRPRRSALDGRKPDHVENGQFDLACIHGMHSEAWSVYTLVKISS